MTFTGDIGGKGPSPPPQAQGVRGMGMQGGIDMQRNVSYESYTDNPTDGRKDAGDIDTDKYGPKKGTYIYIYI